MMDYLFNKARQLGPSKLSAASSLCAATAVLLAALGVMDIKIRKGHEHSISDIAQNYFELESEISKALSTLNAIDVESGGECTEETLLAMRKILFLNRNIDDIGFYKGNRLLCTTGLGFTNLLIEDDGYYEDSKGRLVWFNSNIEISEEAVAIVIKDEAYNVVVDSARAEFIELGEFNWHATVQRADGTRIKLISQNNHGDSRLFPYAYEYQLCSQDRFLCLSLSYPVQSAVTAHIIELFIVLACCVVIAFTSFFLFKEYYGRLLSEQGRIKRAIKSASGFYLCYQPIIELRTNRVIGCEALARFEDNTGSISPDRFIPIVEALGLTWQFTELVMSIAVNDLEQHTIDGQLKVNINVFPKDIETGKILQFDKLAKFKRNDVSVVIEITESQAFSHESIHHILETLNEQGYLIAIDDFGTGYSTLSQVSDLRADTVKVDRSFIHEVEKKTLKSLIIPHIVEVAKLSGSNVVAEGVENKEQEDVLRSLNVDYVQGFHYAKPLPVGQFIRFMRKHNTVVQDIERENERLTG